MAKASKPVRAAGNGHTMPGTMRGHKPIFRKGQPPMHMMEIVKPSAPTRGKPSGKKGR